MILTRLFKRKKVAERKKYDTIEEDIVSLLLDRGNPEDIVLETCAEPFLGLNQDLVARAVEKYKIGRLEPGRQLMIVKTRENEYTEIRPTFAPGSEKPEYNFLNLEDKIKKDIFKKDEYSKKNVEEFIIKYNTN